MVDPTAVDDSVSVPVLSDDDEGLDSLPIPPLDPSFFSQDLAFTDCQGSIHNSFLSFNNNDVVDGDFDFDLDITFDDFDAPSGFLNPIAPSPPHPLSDPPLIPFDSCSNPFQGSIREPELRHVCIDQPFHDASDYDSNLPVFRHVSDDPSSTLSGLIQEPLPVSDDRTSANHNLRSQVASQLPIDLISDVSELLSFPSSESSGNNKQSSHKFAINVSNPPRASNSSSSDPEIRDAEVFGPASSQGSGNCGSYASENLNCASSPVSGDTSRSMPSSPDFVSSSKNNDFVDQQIKLEEIAKATSLKRKKENEGLHSMPRTSKYQRSIAYSGSKNASDAITEEEEKRKARLMRNRESAQLSRQRKKHYVEELEDKVRSMHSTIQDLNSKLSYIMAENASLKVQLGSNPMYPPAAAAAGGMYSPPQPQVLYSWMPCPPYMVKPQGTHVPLVPIPRLKPQQPVSAPKIKKVESNKTEGKTKKIASLCLLGILFFLCLFGAYGPTLDVNRGGIEGEFASGVGYTGGRFYEKHRERVLAVTGFPNRTHIDRNHACSNIHCPGSYIGRGESNNERGCCGHFGNDSEPLVASLYVPRNDKLVKIDGNLIIHSVLASERAMASNKNSKTDLAVPGDLTPAIRQGYPRLYRGSAEPLRALSPGSTDAENLKSTSSDGKLQQWFREGLAGPMLSSGMCTEVFQFDASPASGAIVPASPARNISAQHTNNSLHPNYGRNRRILHSLPIPFDGSSNHNITEEQLGNSEKVAFHGNNSVSSMVVSVLVDPREAGDDDGVMGGRSLSRIFVVVLLDSVKYVTYSCMLPFKGAASHLVTT